jgi:hypothetical protein
METKLISYIKFKLAQHCRINNITTKEGMVDAMDCNKRQWVAEFIQATA